MWKCSHRKERAIKYMLNTTNQDLLNLSLCLFSKNYRKLGGLNTPNAYEKLYNMLDATVADGMFVRRLPRFRSGR